MTDEERFRNAVIFGTSHPEMYMTPEQAEIERLRAEVATLRAALKPFAELMPLSWPHKNGHYSIDADEIRAAAAALKETGDE